MRFHCVLLLFIILFCTFCSPQKAPKSFDIQGHRGCRGLEPENSVSAFEKALELGVTTLELDVVITKDSLVVVSHEPFLSHAICLNNEGKPFSEDEELGYNIYTMTYENLKQFDCGSKPHPRFMEQRKLKTSKPLLSDIIALAEKANPEIQYNIEIKRKPEWDNVYHPQVKVYADMVLAQVKKSGILDKTYVQSFDIETLQYVRKAYPNVRLVFLVQNKMTPIQNMSNLGFVPEVYSPYFQFVSSSTVDYCHQNEMLLIPWTVNEVSDISEMIKLGVDGIISDYPDKVIEYLSENVK